MGKPDEDTAVFFDESDIENLRQGGLPLATYNQQRARDDSTVD